MEEEMPKKGGMNPIVTGAAGAVIGAGVAVAATKMMTDKKLRDKVFHTITGIKEKARDSIERVRERAKDMGEMAEHRIRRVRKITK